MVWHTALLRKGQWRKTGDISNLFHVQRETAVLEEVRKYGEMRGIYREVAPQDGGFLMVDDKIEALKREIPKTPEDVANVLRGWLDS